MAKRSLKLSWDLCMAQWNWIKAEIEAGNKDAIKDLKKRWLEEHEHKGVAANCFFCDYDGPYGLDIANCSNCPARLIDTSFHCGNHAYHYTRNPLAFHAELTRLHKIFISSL